MSDLELEINEKDAVWIKVAAYAKARRAELLEEIDSVGASDQARRDAVIRRDELAILMAAPNATLDAKLTHQVAGLPPSLTY